jgi:hypothetical protein
LASFTGGAVWGAERGGVIWLAATYSAGSTVNGATCASDSSNGPAGTALCATTDDLAGRVNRAHARSRAREGVRTIRRAIVDAGSIARAGSKHCAG